MRSNPRTIFVPRIGALLVLAGLGSLPGAGCHRPLRPVAPTPASQASRSPAPSPSPSPAPNRVSAPPVAPQPFFVPLPESVRVSPTESFRLLPTTPVVVQASDERALAVGRFAASLMNLVGAPARPVSFGAPVPGDGSFALILDPAFELGDEGYRLSVAPDGIRIVARTAAGLFYGVQTFRQMLPVFLEHDAARPRPVVVAAAEISDRPRFAWRGAMLDVARHFFSVGEVKRYIDLLALHKLNVLHLHLSDDQGFRIDIRSWPKLATVGGSTEVGGGTGGFYTQDEYAGIVAYAAQHFITVVPEIDMPGHTNAALASYPELNCDGVAPPLYTDIRVGFSALCVGDERTYAFIDDVVREIAALTPGPFFHIGGDEVKKLSPEQYAAFIERAQAIVERHGKRAIGWDEIVHAPLRPASAVQHWRYDKGAELQKLPALGVKVVLSPANRTYVDMQYDRETALGLAWAGRIELQDAYSWDPGLQIEGVPESSILGVEAPLWSETVATISEVETLAFPRISALAEVGWSPQSTRTWEDFRVRLGAQAPRYQALGINFYRSPQIPWLASVPFMRPLATPVP